MNKWDSGSGGFGYLFPGLDWWKDSNWADAQFEGNGGGSAGQGMSGSGTKHDQLPDYMDPADDPCEKLKNKQKDIQYLEKFNALNQNSIFSMNRERGFFERQSPPLNNIGFAFLQLDGQEGTTGLSLPDNLTGIVGLLHSHNDRDGVIKIFSPTDVRTFINHFMPQANSNLGSYSKAYSTVVTSEGSYTLQYTLGTHSGGVNHDTFSKWNTWYEKEYTNLIVENNLTQANVAETLSFTLLL